MGVGKEGENEKRREEKRREEKRGKMFGVDENRQGGDDETALCIIPGLNEFHSTSYLPGAVNSSTISFGKLVSEWLVDAILTNQ